MKTKGKVEQETAEGAEKTMQSNSAASAISCS
jgi:hypothetical protein